jgi:hypothetical protein
MSWPVTRAPSKLYGRIGNDIVIGGLGQDLLTGDEGGMPWSATNRTAHGGAGLAKETRPMQPVGIDEPLGADPALGLGGFGSSGNDACRYPLGRARWDAFFTTGTDLAADRNAFGYGPDLN